MYKLSYDYEDLIKEVELDLLNGDLKLEDKVDVVRERVFYNGEEVYQAIVDYGFNGTDVSLKDMEDGDIKEKLLVKDMLEEMKKMNKLL